MPHCVLSCQAIIRGDMMTLARYRVEDNGNQWACQRSSGVEQRFRNPKPGMPIGAVRYKIEPLC